MFDRLIQVLRLMWIVAVSGGEVEYLLKDSLTGLYRREVFLRLLPRHLSLLERHRRPATVVIFDLDGLKKINDSLGHRAGDAFISGFAAGLKTSLRLSDIACRWGGDEFVAVVDGAEADAHIFASRVRDASGVIPFSYGINLIEGDFESALDKADKRMYGTKCGRE